MSRSYLAMVGVVASNLILSPPAEAQQVDSLLYVPPNYSEEQPERGPSAAFSSEGFIAIADEVDQKIKIYREPSLEEMLAALPYPSSVISVEQIFISSMGLVVKDQSGVSHTLSLPNEVSFPLAELEELEGELQQDGSVILSLNGESIGSVNPENSAASITDWSYVGAGGGGGVVLINEARGDDLYGRVLRMDEGRLVETAEFSWGIFDFVPKDPVHLSSEGEPWVIALRDGDWSHDLAAVVTAERSAVEADSAKEFFVDQANSPPVPAIEALVSKQQEVFDDALADRALSDYTVIDHAMLKFADMVDFPLRAPAGVTREDAVARALLYYSMPFFLRQRNIKDLGSEWRSPTNLVGQVGTWRINVPYGWGQYMSLRRFVEGLIAGHVAGDIYTDKPGGMAGVVGCDCSGCVSAWLGIKRLSTTGISEDAEDLFRSVKLSEMRPGDLFNRRGSHVRMLLNAIEGPSGVSYRVIESAKSCNGVCIRVYKANELRGYQPLTYRKFLN